MGVYRKHILVESEDHSPEVEPVLCLNVTRKSLQANFRKNLLTILAVHGRGRDS